MAAFKSSAPPAKPCAPPAPLAKPPPAKPPPSQPSSPTRKLKRVASGGGPAEKPSSPTKKLKRAASGDQGAAKAPPPNADVALVVKPKAKGAESVKSETLQGDRHKQLSKDNKRGYTALRYQLEKKGNEKALASYTSLDFKKKAEWLANYRVDPTLSWCSACTETRSASKRETSRPGNSSLRAISDRAST